MTPRRNEHLAVLGLAVAAVAAALLVPTYPNYDSFYALVWGRELLDGSLPSFEAYATPTQHPLWNVVGALLGAVFGDNGDRAVVVVCAVGHVVLCWGTYRLGAAVAGRAVGVVAALLVGSSFAFLLFAARGYVDVPFLALVIWAGAVEAERTRAERPSSPPRGGEDRRSVAIAMGLLATAGLLRPEAWVLAGLYWLWHVADSRALRSGLLAGAAVAPVLWALSDVVVTGDPLYSLNATSALAEALGRDRGIGGVPRAFVSFLSDTARPPVAAAAILGALLAWRSHRALRLRALHVLVALFGAGAVTFVGVGVAGLSILPRYLTVPVVAMCLLAALALAGWTLLERAHPRRRAWMLASVGAALAGALAMAVVKADAPSRFATELRYLRAVHEDLEGILAVPAVERARACGPVSLPNYRLTPDARWVLDTGEDGVAARSDPERARAVRTGGVALVAVGEKNVRRIGRADGTPRTTNRPPPGFTEAARNRTFVAYVRC